MSETTEQRTLGPSLQPAEIAAGFAKDAQENLAGLDVVNVSHIFADEVNGELYLQVYTVLPNRANWPFQPSAPSWAKSCSREPKLAYANMANTEHLL